MASHRAEKKKFWQRIPGDLVVWMTRGEDDEASFSPTPSSVEPPANKAPRGGGVVREGYLAATGAARGLCHGANFIPSGHRVGGWFGGRAGDFALTC
jgi:hypothetical protein